MAGSKPGERRGGRQKGTPNKRTVGKALAVKAVDRVTDEQLMPLVYALAVLRDPKSTPEDKRWACQTAMPYCHPKYQTLEVKGTGPVLAGPVQINVHFLRPQSDPAGSLPGPLDAGHEIQGVPRGPGEGEVA